MPNTIRSVEFPSYNVAGMVATRFCWKLALHLHGQNRRPEHGHPGTGGRGSKFGVGTAFGRPLTGGSAIVGAAIGVGTCPFEIWSRACSASCCTFLSGAVRSATAHLPESFSHSLIKSSIDLTIELAAALAFATAALACLTASLRSGGLSPRASAGPFLYKFATARQSQYIVLSHGGGFSSSVRSHAH
jgi:hypothetical protein